MNLCASELDGLGRSSKTSIPWRATALARSTPSRPYPNSLLWTYSSESLGTEHLRCLCHLRLHLLADRGLHHYAVFEFKRRRGLRGNFRRAEDVLRLVTLPAEFLIGVHIPVALFLCEASLPCVNTGELDGIKFDPIAGGAVLMPAVMWFVLKFAHSPVHR